MSHSNLMGVLHNPFCFLVHWSIYLDNTKHPKPSLNTVSSRLVSLQTNKVCGILLFGINNV